MATQRMDPRTARTNGPAPGTQDGPQTRELLKQLASDGSDLVRNEIALAKLEMSQVAREIAADSAKLAGAIGIALLGGLTLIAAAVIALGNALDGRYALSALIIGIVMLLIGGLLARGGITGLRGGTKPEQTMRSLQEDKRWAQQEAREFKEHIRS